MRILSFIFVLLSIPDTIAQSSIDGGALNINTSRLSSIESIPLRDKPGRDGQIYLVEEMHPGTIWFGKIKIENYLFRYDVSNDLFEISANRISKYLNAYGVSRFEIFKKDSSVRAFRRIEERAINEETLLGYFEVLVEAPVSLFAFHYNVLLPSNYIPGLDVGNRSETSVLKTRFFLKKNDNEFIEVKRKKDLLSQFEEAEEIGRFIKKNKIDLKKRTELVTLTTFINTLSD